MEVIILTREKNQLLNREEIIVKIDHKGEATPKREELKKKIAAMIGKDEKLVVVEKILTYYGKQESKAFVHVYENENDMMKLEPKHILKRNKIIQ
ncbi:MAG: 30S ribosomal protein S24e [Nanopusillaceae archaeon]